MATQVIHTCMLSCMQHDSETRPVKKGNKMALQ